MFNFEYGFKAGIRKRDAKKMNIHRVIKKEKTVKTLEFDTIEDDQDWYDDFEKRLHLAAYLDNKVLIINDFSVSAVDFFTKNKKIQVSLSKPDSDILNRKIDKKYSEMIHGKN